MLKIRGRRGRQEKVFDKPLAKRYKDRIPISAAKKADLERMCNLKIIPERHHSFYRSLPCDGSVRDRLPEPDVTEEMDTSDDETQ